MERFKVTNGPLFDGETAPSFWYVEMVQPIVAEDLTFEAMPAQEGYGTPKHAQLPVKVFPSSELKADLDRLNLMPLEPFTNSHKTLWLTFLNEPLDLRGLSATQKRATKIAAVFDILRQRFAKGEHIEAAVRQVNYEIAEEIRGNNARYVDRVTEMLLTRVPGEWFAQDKTVSSLSETIDMLEGFVQPIREKIQSLYQELQAARCDALLRDLERERWSNNTGQAYPREIREIVEPRLTSRTAYGSPLPGRRLR